MEILGVDHSDDESYTYDAKPHRSSAANVAPFANDGVVATGMAIVGLAGA